MFCKHPYISLSCFNKNDNVDLNKNNELHSSICGQRALSRGMWALLFWKKNNTTLGYLLSNCPQVLKPCMTDTVGLQTLQLIDTPSLVFKWRHFIPLPLQPIISRRSNPYLLRHFAPIFNPHIYLFSTPISKTSQPIYRRPFNLVKPIFTGNKFDIFSN